MNLKLPILNLQLLLAFSLLTNAAEDGKQLFAQMCAACHGAKGQGVGGNVFPPLDGSEWLQGDPNRIAQIMLHGLAGPVTVKGKVYDLAMPAQGSLSDEGKLAVIRYVRKEFVGEETKFSLADLQKTTKAHEKRTTAWTAKELLKLYPLPLKKSPISNLIMKVYHGEWKKIPDFSKLEAVAVEEEHAGFISLNNINKKNSYGLVWRGDLEAPKSGAYQFELMADDGAAVFINDIEVARVKGSGRMNAKRASKGKIELKKGSHKIKVQYFQSSSRKGISLKWVDLAAKDKKKASQWLSDPNLKNSKRPAVVIDLTPTDGKTRMYRNFIKGSTHRTMGVGFPQGHNIAFSTQDCQPDLIWKGKFINAGKHWTGRGQGAQIPLSNDVVNLGQGVAWSIDGENLKLKLAGYTMDKMGSPTFNYKALDTGITFNEQYISSEDDLTRVITIKSDTDQSLRLRLAKTNSDSTMPKLGAIIDGKLVIDAALASSEEDELSSIISIKKGINIYKVNYSWKK
jgi:mono/diheme cytochrome c family protein